MIKNATAVWGITDTAFLTCYGVLCLAAVTAIWYGWQSMLGGKGGSNDPWPDLGVYKLALLSGGPQLAITAAAVHLHRAKRIRGDRIAETLETCGELDLDADPLEHEVFEAIRREPHITARAMREQVAASEAMRALQSELTWFGLVPGEAQRALVRRVRLAGAVVVAIGVAWIVAGLQSGAGVGVVAVLTAAVAFATWLIRRSPPATSRGGAIVERQRSERPNLRRHPTGGDSVLAAALFGGGALWIAEPAIASTLGVPRESGRGGASSGACGGGGGCGTVCSSGGGGGGGGGCGGGGGGGGGGCGGGA